MGKFLDRIYTIAGGIAAFSILIICVVVTAQVSLNILARIGGPSFSFTIPSYADFAGFSLSTATFMAMAFTFRAGTHIRVNLLVQNLPSHARLLFEIITLAIGAGFMTYATWFSAGLLLESLSYGDMSTGIIAIPLWIPQIAMVLGLGLLAIAFVHTLVDVIQAGKPVLVDEGSE